VVETKQIQHAATGLHRQLLEVPFQHRIERPRGEDEEPQQQPEEKHLTDAGQAGKPRQQSARRDNQCDGGEPRRNDENTHAQQNKTA
jgi:hypothetical protein